MAAGVDSNWSCWSDGSFTHVGQLIGGDVLGLWLLASSLLSNWGLFSAELFEDSFQLLGRPRPEPLTSPRPHAPRFDPRSMHLCDAGMAEAGLAPRVFGRRLAGSGVPLPALSLQLLLIVLLVSLDFSAILAIT